MPLITHAWLSCLLLVQAPTDSKTPTRPDSAAFVAALETAVSDSIDAAQDSVVAISRIRRAETSQTNAVKGRQVPVAPDFRPIAGVFDPMSQDFQSFDYASGVVVGPQGQILTTFHSIQGADAILVRAAKRQEFFAEIIAADPRSDLAVIVPKTTTMAGAENKPPVLKPLPLGNADKLRRGAFLLALGNPFNSAKDGQPSTAFGILSNRARRLDLSLEDGVSGRQLRHLPTLLQLDTKLNMGMSGGAVVNMKGELVALSTTGGNPQGFDAQAGYAIPMDTLTRRALASLLKGEAVEYGFLGVSLNASGNNIINGVSPNTPAAKAGLLPQDEIITIGDTEITDGDTLVLAVNEYPVESAIKIRIRRDNQEIEKTVIVSKFPVTGEVIATNKPQPWRGIDVDFQSMGLLGNANNADIQFLRNMQTSQDGVLVMHVDPNSPAFGKIKVGELIVSVDGKNIKSPREFRDAVAGLKGKVIVKTPESDIEIPE